MKRIWPGLLIGAVASALMATTTQAKVTPEQAAQLGDTLTPMGAEVAANADGTIPRWNGGQTAAPPNYAGAGTRYVDPYPDDAPLFTISAANLDAHRGQLTPGQIALFDKYPDSYAIKVYPTRRSFANPIAVYTATRQNAERAELSDDGESIHNASLGIPFPNPANGREVVWNHRLRYRDVSVRRWNNQFAVSASGEYNAVKFREDQLLLYALPDIKQPRPGNALLFLTRVVTAPARLAHSFTLIHDDLDGSKHPREAWQFNPGQEQWRRASNVAYDNYATATDGLRTHDQADMFSGALDRYDWKLLGKREIYIPVNAYRLHSAVVKYGDLIRKNHINPEYARYELRRVWVVDARVKKGGVNNLYSRRTLYLDEDSWQIALAEVYDDQDALWRVQEAHSLVEYDHPWQASVLQTLYDLPSGRYLAEGLNNEDPETAERPADPDEFTPSRAARLARK